MSLHFFFYRQGSAVQVEVTRWKLIINSTRFITPYTDYAFFHSSVVCSGTWTMHRLIGCLYPTYQVRFFPYIIVV
jgi:hypothetical protein